MPSSADSRSWAQFLALRFWPVHLLALVCVGVAATLGAWQYDAWQTRRSAEAADLTRLDPVPLAEVMGPDDPFPGDRVGHPVVLEGTWVPEGTVYVSGRPADDGADTTDGESGDETGYWVVTPLAVSGENQPALPVVRGWTPALNSAPAPPTGAAELVGWLQPPEGSGATDADPADDVLPQLRIADLVQRVDQDLYGAYAVIADRAAPGTWPVGDRATNPGTEGLEPATLEQLPDAGRFTAVRNLLYAVEWWVFGAFAAFIWWRYLRDARAAKEPESEPVRSDA